MLQLLESARFQCTEEILTIAAMISVSSPFVIPDEAHQQAYQAAISSRRNFTAEQGDHLTLVNAYKAFVHPQVGKESRSFCKRNHLAFAPLARAVSIRMQLKRYLKRFGMDQDISCEGDEQRVRRCLVCALGRNAAKRMSDGSFRSLSDDSVSKSCVPRSLGLGPAPQKLAVKMISR